MNRAALFHEALRGLSSSTTAEHRYPYDKPSETTVNRGGAASSSTELPKPAKHHRFRPSDLEETMHTLIDHVRHNRHMKQIWEVAVKRNAMTTSLALLGGVLLADVYIYPEKKSRSQHAALRAKLAPAPAAAAADASSNKNSSSSSNSSSRIQGDISTSHPISAGTGGRAPAHV